MGIVERILELMEIHNVNAATLTREISLTNGLISQWKKEKQKPSTEAIIKLSKYFNVSTDYLLTGIEKSLELAKDEKEWLDLYHNLPLSERRECVGFVKGYIERSRKDIANTPDRKVAGK